VARLVLALAAGLAAVVLAVPPAGASPRLLIGIYDEPETLYGNPAVSFPILESLRVQVLRVNLYWGGRYGVARRRPADATNPNDPAYNWSAYDRTVQFAADHGIKVLLSIVGTPRWANRGAGMNRRPTDFGSLEKFAYAAATRYSGRSLATDGRRLPPVRHWVAWNEPNNPVFLKPQFRRSGGTWIVQSAIDYAEICAAVYRGVHATMIHSQKVACGVTAPRGNNNPSSSRPSVAPVAFLTALKKAGLKHFDAYAHHPYYANPAETPRTRPLSPNGAAPTAVTLANIDVLLAALARLYGPRRVWITEYGYQTNPPDRIFGVPWARQALYLKESFEVARKSPRIDMMLWFLLKDEPILAGWQSGLITSSGRRKPAFRAYQQLSR
jgi:hypothetical protein